MHAYVVRFIISGLNYYVFDGLGLVEWILYYYIGISSFNRNIRTTAARSITRKDLLQQ